MIELEGLLVASLGVPSAAQRPTPSENVKYGSWRRNPLHPHIPVFIKRLHFPGKAVTNSDREWNAWRQRNLEILKNRILDVSRLGVTCTLHSYGYRLEEDPCSVVRRTYRGNILQYTLGPPELDEAGKISVLLDVARALEHLHSQSTPIVHGGIHPTEILIDDQGHAVLLDFGLGHIVARLESPPACAPSMRHIPWGGYYAPEIIEQLPPTPAVDVFAFAGVILVVMSRLHPHFDFPYPEAAHIINGKPRRSAHPSLSSEHQLWQMMEEMWDPTAWKRPAMPIVVQALGNLLATHSHNPAPLPGIQVDTPPSTFEISNPRLEELIKMALNTFKLEQRPSGYSVLLSELLDRLDKEHSPEFDGVLEIIHPDIAHGAFSQIARCNWLQVLPDGTTSVVAVAVKTLKIKHISDWSDGQKQERINKRIRRESRLWKNLQHEHILPLYGFRSRPGEPYLVSPWCQHGDLASVLANNHNINVIVRLSLALQVGKGLRYLHTRSPPITHGDIKPGNVLINGELNGELRALICDFGLSRVIQELPTGYTTDPECGTARYRAPELWLGEKPSLEGDVYAYGCVILKCYSLLDPFPNYNATPDITRAVLMNCEVSPAGEHWLEATNPFYRIMCWCCQACTEDRASIVEVVDELDTELTRLRHGEPNPTY